MMLLVLDITAGSTGPTFASATTTAIVDNILNIVKRVELSITEAQDLSPRLAVAASGSGLIEYAEKVGLSLDRSTLQCVALSQGASLANNLKFRVTIPIYLVEPQIAEPLRNFCLLPVHTYPVDPILNVDFTATADYASSGTISAIVPHLFIVRRVMSAAQTQQIIGQGGFLRQDLTETLYQLPLGVSGEQRLHLPLSGQVSSMVFRQYLGGSTLTRAVVDQTTTFGSESVWQLQQGTTPKYEWRWKDLHILTDLNNPVAGLPANVFVAATSAGAVTTALAVAPAVEGPAASGTTYLNPASNLLDFLSDGSEGANELGGLLDLDLPIAQGQNLDLVGNIASVSSNASVVGIVMHKFYGDLSRWVGVA